MLLIRQGLKIRLFEGREIAEVFATGELDFAVNERLARASNVSRKELVAAFPLGARLAFL